MPNHYRYANPHPSSLVPKQSGDMLSPVARTPPMPPRSHGVSRRVLLPVVNKHMQKVKERYARSAVTSLPHCWMFAENRISAGQLPTLQPGAG